MLILAEMFVIFAAVGALTPEGCEEGWQHFRDHCYIFISGEVHFDTAKAVCRMKGANVTSLWQQDEIDFISKHLKQMMAEYESAWVGLVPHGDEQKWMWIDGSQTELPSVGTPSPSYDICGSLRSDGNLMYVDCDYVATAFVCKKPLQMIYLPEAFLSTDLDNHGYRPRQTIFQRLFPPVLENVRLEDMHYLATVEVKVQTDCAVYCYTISACRGFLVRCKIEARCNDLYCTLLSGVTTVKSTAL